MKKVSAKPGQLVRSASRRGKSAAPFQFDITVERVFGSIIRPGNQYYIKWARGVKIAHTKPMTAEKEHVGGSRNAGGLLLDHKMSLLVTLYRESDSGPGSLRFDEKECKLSLISVSRKGHEKTVGKVHFDLSPYAGIPSASQSKSIKFSENASANVTIDSRFSKSGSSGTGSDGESSTLSGMTGASRGSSDDNDGMEDDLGDLAISSVPEPEATAVASSPVSNSSAPRGVVGRRKSSGNADTLSSSAASGGGTSVVDPRKKQSSASSSTSTKNAPSYNPSSARFVSNEMQKQASGNSNRSDSTGAANSVAAGFGSTGGSERDMPGSDTNGNDIFLQEKLKSLQDEHERVALDLRRAQDKRKRIEAAHETEVRSLQRQLADAKKSLSEELPNRAEADTRRVEELSARVEELTRDLKAVTDDRDAIRSELEQLRVAAREAETLRGQNRQLSRDVDRLTLAAAAAAAAAGGHGDVAESNDVQERMLELQSEKEDLENKLQAHKSHVAKVRDTYSKLSRMYNVLREDNIRMQSKMDDLENEKLAPSTAVNEQKCDRTSSADDSSPHDPSTSDATSQIEELRMQLVDANRAVENVETSKASLQRDHDRLAGQVESYQERIERLSEELDAVRAETDELHAHASQLAVERDAAVQRGMNTGAAAGGFDEAKYAEAHRIREQVERELIRTRQRVDELERELVDATDELEYERSEKLKAREERDALRESARALERRTSQVSQTADTVHTLERQLSAHKMRDADQTAMIADLRDEVQRLQSGVAGPGLQSFGSHDANTSDADVVEDLVMTKLALATAEDEKLELQFSLKKLKKAERVVQERLAAHASELEVKLSRAKEEIQRLREHIGDDTMLM